MRKINKKVLVPFIIVLMIAFMLIFLTSCKNDIKIEEKTIDISSAEQFYAIRDNVGLEYSKYTYNITKDLDLTEKDWIPIGTSSKEPFMGTINGNNHTIKIKINEEKDSAARIRVAELADNRVYALIGYALNSKISNLNMDIDFKLTVNAMTMYSASLIAFAEDKVKIENVNVQGAISMKMLEILEVQILDDGDEEEIKSEADRGATTQYIGGVVAYSINDNEIKKASSKVDVFVGDIQNAGKGYDSVEKSFVGGIVGYTRLSQGNGNYSRLNQVDYEGTLKVSARSAFLGGIVGTGDYTCIANANIEAKIYSKFDKSSSVGGVAGQLKHSELSYVYIKDSLLNVGKINKVHFNEASNVGGITGYAANNTVIKECLIEDIAVQLAKGSHYAGGFVGRFTFSSISDCAVSGGIELYKNNNFIPIEEFPTGDFDFSKDNPEPKDYLETIKFSAGMFGELIYKVTLGNLASEFNALYPISGAGFKTTISQSVSGDVKTYLESKGYGPYDDYIEKVKEEKPTKEQEEDGVTPYLVTFKEHVLLDSNITYKKGTYFCTAIKDKIGEAKFEEFCKGEPYLIASSKEVDDSILFEDIASKLDEFINN